MDDFLNGLIPNIMAKPDVYVRSIKETFAMLGWAGVLSFVLGIFLGVVLIVTQKGGVMENAPIYQTLDKVINFFRSIPCALTRRRLHRRTARKNPPNG